MSYFQSVSPALLKVVPFQFIVPYAEWTCPNICIFGFILETLSKRMELP